MNANKNPFVFASAAIGPGDDYISQDGLELKDYLAAKAMQSIVNNPEYWQGSKECAVMAYNVAEAMLEERLKRIEEGDKKDEDPEDLMP